MNPVSSGATFEWIPIEVGTSGLAGTLAIAIDDGQGTIVYGPATAGVVEIDVAGNPSGTYSATGLTAPGPAGQYILLASIDGSFDPETVLTEELVVVAAGQATTFPQLEPLDDADSPSGGPCSAWTTSDQVAACGCDLVGSDTTLLDGARDAASELLYFYSGGQYAGVCERTVRPCQTTSLCGFQVLDRGYVVGPGWGWDGWNWGGRRPCGCRALSRVRLPGQPVREILEVRIDGTVVDPAGYQLVRRRWLVRLADGTGRAQQWPSCQRLDLPAGAVGTWTVQYTSGRTPPLTGQMAAAELACQIYKQCAEDEDCELPSGATTITRQGVTIQREFFATWGRDPRTGVWRTGLALTDAFLNAVNPNGLRRGPAIASPDQVGYGQPV